jgi:DinB superfamily
MNGEIQGETRRIAARSRAGLAASGGMAARTLSIKGEIGMKTLLAFCMVAATPLLAVEGGAMNDAERAVLVSQLEASKKDFLSSLEGVTAAQWKFKPAPNVWSVAECAEHIILSEDFLFNTAQQILKTEAVARPATSTAETDQKLIALVGDRSHKATAPEPIVPSGKLNTPGDAAKAFTEKRNKSLEYARTTNDDLRIHITKGPIGTMDAYQFLLLMASHTGRHTVQLREVQANPDYPKVTAKVQ